MKDEVYRKQLIKQKKYEISKSSTRKIKRNKDLQQYEQRMIKY
ncbi:unnamed protein product [Paramecium sonneborni]|uniref:Uncharacterized protein n=1 Tax=Paramecium sonneborni TaxID=65129 RepID=A0A8S1LW21_9CILI|nr:unnamed protein product [Paramecium sonneborni]